MTCKFFYFIMRNLQDYCHDFIECMMILVYN